jgi:GNAT superfamily N-acetyltransferase
MKIRKAQNSDIDQLALLFDAYRVFYEKSSDINGAKKFLSDRITANESEIVVAENPENKLVGFVQLYPIFSSTRMKRLWLLNDLYVSENHRGQGISKLLMEHAQDFAKETQSAGLILETAKTNTIGNQLYPLMGFILDTEHNYYSWEY